MERDIEQTIAMIDERTRFLRIRDVVRMVGFSKSKIYELVKEGFFPKPLRLGPRCVVWLNVEIAEWIVEKVREDAEFCP